MVELESSYLEEHTMVTDTNTTDISSLANAANDETGDKALDTAKSLLESAQEAISGAVEATVGAVKENPVAAAAIAAGAAAAVGGAVYAASHLGGDKPNTSGKTASRKK
ncbi:hypothetical protein [Sphingomonas soli]|uniref:hypothetical protein n=1 Tax=Sphingomonas soli TaxID=266127 RepID=UPI000AB7D077|nr:hypothetical protein [Sphingomonas soli]